MKLRWLLLSAVSVLCLLLTVILIRPLKPVYAAAVLTPDYPPPSTLCQNYEFTNEPHPLRPAPALVCKDKVPEPFNLSCGNDVIPKFSVSRPRTIANPGDSVNAATNCVKSGCRWNCTRRETLTEAIIGPVNITIDLTGLELPIAGIASRNCDTGYCDVDQINSATGDKNLSDGFLMRNYTSWYLQGAIEQADQIPPDIQPKFLDRALAYAGPLKKLIPREILDGLQEQNIAGQREELIEEAAAGRTYNQIVGYVNGNKVISRLQAKSAGLTGSEQIIRLSDMINHLNPPYNPDSPQAVKWYTLWQQVPFASSGHVDVAGEFFPTACLRSEAEPRRCESDPKVLDAKFQVTSGLDSFRVYFPHLVEDDTLLMKLLQNALVAQEISRTDAIPTYTELSQNLTNPDRLPEWTVSDGGAYRNADGCRIENALYNPGDSLEAKRNKKQGLITGQLQFKREVSYSYQVSDTCDLNPITGGVPAPVSAPVPVHIRYSHMDEIADRTVVGPGSIFKALYPDIPTTIGDEISNRPAESGLKYSCTAADSCQADSTSHKSSPSAFFPWWGTTLEFFHQKIQAMLDPLEGRLKQIGVPAPLGSDSNSPYATNDIQAALAAAAAKNNVPLSLLQAIYEIEGTEHAAYGSCVQSNKGAVGPMQIVNSPGSAYWMAVDEQERATLNLCNTGDAAEAAARIIVFKVGAGSAGDADWVKRAAKGYYGSCQPDSVTQGRWGDGIGYCDFVLYRVGLCPALASTCDGE